MPDAASFEWVSSGILRVSRRDATIAAEIPQRGPFGHSARGRIVPCPSAVVDYIRVQWSPLLGEHNGVRHELNRNQALERAKSLLNILAKNP